MTIWYENLIRKQLQICTSTNGTVGTAASITTNKYEIYVLGLCFNVTSDVRLRMTDLWAVFALIYTVRRNLVDISDVLYSALSASDMHIWPVTRSVFVYWDMYVTSMRYVYRACSRSTVLSNTFCSSNTHSLPIQDMSRWRCYSSPGVFLHRLEIK